MPKIELVSEIKWVEIYFEEKPPQKTRDKLRELSWIWNSQKKCWYCEYSKEAYEYAKKLNTIIERAGEVEETDTRQPSKKESLKHRIQDLLKYIKVPISNELINKLQALNVKELELIEKKCLLILKEQDVKISSEEWEYLVGLVNAKYLHTKMTIFKRTLSHFFMIKKNKDIKKTISFGEWRGLIFCTTETFSKRIEELVERRKKQKEAYEAELNKRNFKRKASKVYEKIYALCDGYGIREEVIKKLAEQQVTSEEVNKRLDVIDDYKEKYPQKYIRYGDYILLTVNELETMLKNKD